MTELEAYELTTRGGRTDFARLIKAMLSTHLQEQGFRTEDAVGPELALRDVLQAGDPRRRLSKRKKDELDLIRLAEAHPEPHPVNDSECA